MNKTLLSLALAATFAAGLALAGTASAQFGKGDLGYQDAGQPSLQLVRGGGVDKQDPFEELRERRRQQQEQQSRTDGTRNGKTEGADEKTKQDEDSKGGFFGLFNG